MHISGALVAWEEIRREESQRMQDICSDAIDCRRMNKGVCRK